MAAVIRAGSKPCIVYKILAAGRKCDTPQAVVDAFHYAYDNIKPTDIVNVGMFQKYKNQVKEMLRSSGRILPANNQCF